MNILISTEASLAGRRAWLQRAGALAASIWLPGAVADQTVFAEVWKDPDCGCCKDWVAHLQDAGMRVRVHDTGNEAMRSKLGIARQYASCHTARIGGYAIEGHVPAQDILRLLRERRPALGLAVAGMPIGSPGMDGAIYGKRWQAYDVLLLAKDGSATVYRHYQGSSS